VKKAGGWMSELIRIKNDNHRVWNKSDEIAKLSLANDCPHFLKMKE